MLVAKKDKKELSLFLSMATRHGLVAGSTGSGKTVTLQALAESFAQEGVSVFMSDIKGDLRGMSQPGGTNSKVAERFKQLGESTVSYKGNHVEYLDVFGEKGNVIQTSINSIGPLLLSRLLTLSPAQEVTLLQIFKIAEQHKLVIYDLPDLKSMIHYIVEHAKSFEAEGYGKVSIQSLGAIERSLLYLEQGASSILFSRNVFDIENLFAFDDEDQRGYINILSAERLINYPKVYSTLLLWILSELYKKLPEKGDCAKPELVLFFDEAHLLFADAPKILVDNIIRTVKLIRSKGVGVFFVTQHPSDIPDGVLSQLGNRIQHAMRSFTLRDKKAVKAIAESFRVNKTLDVENVITELKVGEALVSFLQEDGSPSMVERAFIIPPKSMIGTLK